MPVNEIAHEFVSVNSQRKFTHDEANTCFQ